MEAYLNRLSKLFGNIFNGIIISFTVCMFLVVGTNVFSRYVLNYSLAWADELPRFLFIWISFLGAVLAYYHDEHVGLDFFVKRIPSKKIQIIIRLINDLAVFLVLIVLAHYGLKVALSTINNSPAMNIPMKVVYMIVPIAGTMMALINIHKIINKVKALKCLILNNQCDKI
jgi:TRAP-type C4-dicarboxylate transport system permease small subunit